MEVLPCRFQFTDPQSANTPQRFYRVWSPQFIVGVTVRLYSLRAQKRYAGVTETDHPHGLNHRITTRWIAFRSACAERGTPRISSTISSNRLGVVVLSTKDPARMAVLRSNLTDAPAATRVGLWLFAFRPGGSSVPGFGAPGS
jgi:hypothetical protein